MAGQEHGIFMEKWLGKVLTGIDLIRPPNALWDIPAVLDLKHNLPTSVKTVVLTKEGKIPSIGLADCRRFFSINEPFRLLIVVCKQVGDYKHPQSVYEVIVQPKEIRKIRGSLTMEIVTQFHEEICRIPKGDHKNGREQSKKTKAALVKAYPSRTILNPKVGGDGDDARRLQCSVRIQTLQQIGSDIRIHEGEFHGHALPIFFSPPRKSKEFKVSNVKQSWGEGWCPAPAKADCQTTLRAVHQRHARRPHPAPRPTPARARAGSTAGRSIGPRLGAVARGTAAQHAI